MRILVILLLAVPAVRSTAQWDSLDYAPRDTSRVLYTPGFDLREGIYFTFDEFRNNRPAVALKDLLDDQGRPIGDLRNYHGKVHYADSASQGRSVQVDKSIWGFCDRDIIYVNIGDGFFRIGMMGSIAHIVYDNTYSYRGGYYGGAYGMGPATTTVQEQRLLDVETGAFQPITGAGIEEIIQRDPELRDKFGSLPKKERERERTIFQFVRLYNERHPFYLPK